MKIKYKSIYSEDNSLEQVRLLNTDYCCDEMKEAFDGYFITFGGEYNREAEVSIRSCSPYPEGSWWDYMKINVCPFCGTKIQLIETEKVRRKEIRKQETVTRTEYVEEEIK